MNKKTVITDVFDFKEYLLNTLDFVKNPSLVGERQNRKTQCVAQIDFLRSILMSIGFLILIRDLVPNLYDIDPLELINRTYFMLEM